MWRIAAGALAGTCLLLALPRLPPTPWLWLGCGAVALLALLLRSGWLCACAVAAASCGFALQSALDDRLAPDLENRPVQLSGTVVSVPQGTLQVLKFRVAPDRGANGGRYPRLIELTWYDAPRRIRAAERLQLEVKLRRPRGFANPGGQDNEARMLRERIGASGYVRSARSLGQAPGAWLRYPVLLVRARVAELVRDALGARPSAGIVAGLAVGLQDALNREQWLTLSRSGTSHLMAISGLHIAMVAIVAAWVATRLQRWRQRRGSLLPQRDAAVIAGGIAALGYSLLAGWSVPTQRTMVTMAVAALALLLRRRVGIADGLGLCVCAVLLLDPLAPLAPGFWLSFGAVAVILFAATGHVQRPAGWRAYLEVQGVVTVGLTPVLVGSFGAVSLVSAIVNLYAIPLYTLLVVPAVLVSCAVGLAWAQAGNVLLDWTGRLIETTWPLLEVPAAWPLATWSIAGLGPVAWFALLVGTLAALAPLPASGRIAGLVLALAACLSRPALVPPGSAHVTILDVGQGLAVVVETRNHTLVYDAGPSFRTGTDTGQLVVVPYLRHRGIRSLDVLAVSHDDDDHKGGAASILGLLPVQRLVTGPSLQPGAFGGHEPARARCLRGQRWSWDGVGFEWQHPGPGHYERDNDGSCVLLVQAHGRRLLLTGDIEAVAEAEWLETNRTAAVDVVVAPHHGSRTSSTAAFVAATHPAWVVYAVGHRNRWNFPVTRVVERWESVGARGLLTSASGAVTFVLGPAERLEPREWRRETPRIWRDP